MFFNGKTTYDSPYNYDLDYNKAYTGAAGGRREIVIKLNFAGFGNGKLKDDFWIIRIFDSLNSNGGARSYGSSDPEINAAIENHDGMVTREFTRFYNRLRYIYIPTVRDRRFTKRLFTEFEGVINGSTQASLNGSLESINKTLEDKSKTISNDFEKMLNHKTRVRLSTKTTDILENLGIDVETDMIVSEKNGGKRPVFTDLFSNGDGVLMSYVPHFLSYISAEQNNKIFIWGFEEPENSLEYSKAQMLSTKFYNEFCKSAQIILTTHSPAFINLDQRDGVNLYRVYSMPDEVKGSSQIKSTREIQQRLLNVNISDDERETLANEIGMSELAQEIENHIKAVQTNELSLKRQLEVLTKPVIYYEGNNLKILNAAKKLYDPNGTYEIKDGGGKDDLHSLYKNLGRIGTNQKVAIIWDPEETSKVSLAKTNHVLPLVLKIYPGNNNIKKGIEACMPESIILANRKKFYHVKENRDGGSTKLINKNAVTAHFENSSDNNDYVAFEPTFKVLKSFFAR